MPDVVFLPNRAGYDGEVTNRFEDFESCCMDGFTDDWTCKKNAGRNDLYLFWFGSPVMQIAGIGICQGDVREEDNVGADWTNFPKLWACSFDPLRQLRNPVTVEQITSDKVLAAWWKSQPWRGRPKSAPLKVAVHLLSLIERLNPRLSSLLGKYRVPVVIQSVEIPDDDDNPPERVKCVISRIVRNTVKGERLKRLYKCRCQACDFIIHVPRPGLDGRYAEVHHLKPLGAEHGGQDNWDNMLVLCPNCHLEFDALAMAIDLNGRLLCTGNKNPQRRKRIRFQHGHSVAAQNINYHLARFQEANAKTAAYGS